MVEEKLSCNLCLFCADIKNPDGSIFCMLKRANNPVNNACAELIDSRSTHMDIKQILDLVKEKRGEKKEEAKKGKKSRIRTLLILMIIAGMISFILGFLAGGSYPRASQRLLHTIKRILPQK